MTIETVLYLVPTGLKSISHIREILKLTHKGLVIALPDLQY